MNIVIFIPVQLFFILLFSKTFGHRNEQPFVVKIAIKWYEGEKESLFKLAANEGKSSNERFELNLFSVDQKSGRAIEPPIANGKTGHYDFARLLIPRSSLRISDDKQNVKEAESRRKGKGIAAMEVGMKDGDEFELHIKMNSFGNGNNQQEQIIIKRFKKLPYQHQILICHFNANPKSECKIKIYDKKMEFPNRRIFFQMNLLQNQAQIFKFMAIECARINQEFLEGERLKHFANGVEYMGRICPSDEYIIHFLINGKIIKFPYNCDEAIYEKIDKKSNIYQLKNNPDGTSECKLLLNDEFEKNGTWKFQELSKQIGEIERKMGKKQPMLWEYFSKQIEIYHKTEQWLEEGEKILQKQNLSNRSWIQKEIKEKKELQKKRALGMPALIAALINWQNYPQHAQSSSHQSQPISQLLHYILYNITQLLQNASTIPGPNQNHSNVQIFEAGTSSQLIASGNVAISVPADNSNLMTQIINPNTSQNAMDGPSPPKRRKSSKHSQRKKARILEKETNQISDEMPAQPAENQLLDLNQPPFMETLEQQQYDDSSGQRHDTGQIQPSKMSPLPQEHIDQGNYQTIYSSLQIPHLTPPSEKQIGPSQSQQPIRPTLGPAVFSEYREKKNEGDQQPREVSLPSVPFHSKLQIGKRAGSAFSEYSKGKGNEGGQGEASPIAQHQNSASANVHQQEQPNPKEGGKVQKNMDPSMQISEAPLPPNLQIDKQKGHGDGQGQHRIILGLPVPKPGQNKRDGKYKGEEGPSLGQKAPKKAKKDKS